MRLLILTQYYPPEIGAPQNRLHELALRLKAKGIDVEVLTAMPNYPKMEIQEGYEKGKVREEVIDGIQVHRAKIYVSTSKSIIKRLLNYFSFVWTSYWRGRKLDSFDYLMVESPPLFLGYSAMRLSRKLKAKMIFNVSDLWPESAEKLGLVTNKQMLAMAYRLEKRCYRRAHLITGQTMGIVDDISTRFPEKKVIWLPNGVDLSYYNPAEIKTAGFREQHGFLPDDFVLFYGGIVGYAQGLDVILHAAKQLEDNPKIKFIIQGAGPEKDRLLEMKKSLGLDNVYFLPPVVKTEMPAILKDINAAIVPLRKLDLFQGAIPSKIFETLAMEVPILLAVDGEARRHFVDKAQAALFIEPENVEQLVEKALWLSENQDAAKQMGRNGRVYANAVFNRDRIAEEFITHLKPAVADQLSSLAEEQKTISVVIPCRNEQPYICECLQAIFNCQLPANHAINVYVVDGMSTDGTRELVQEMMNKFSNLFLVSNTNQLTPFAFNLGLKQNENADFIQIVGARHILSANYLMNALQILQTKPDVWCVGGKIVNEYINETGKYIAKAMSTSFGMGLGNFRTLDKSGYTDTVTSPMYPTWVFDKIGRFDEELIRNQDDEFNFRVAQNGGKIYFDSQISLKYYVRGNYPNLWRQFLQYGYWKVYVNKKHKAVTTLRQLAPPAFVLYLILCLFPFLFSPVLGLIGLSGLAIYALLTLFFSLTSASSSTELINLLLIYPILHISYGWGYLKGVFNFVILNKKPGSGYSELSR